MQIIVTHVTTNERAAQLGRTNAPLEVSITFQDDEAEYKPSADLTVWVAATDAPLSEIRAAPLQEAKTFLQRALAAIND